MIRICTIGDLPRFIHDGLEAVSNWRPFDFAKAEKKTQQALIDHTGRLVQIHPDDAAKLAGLGLEYFEDKGKRRLRRIAKAK